MPDFKTQYLNGELAFDKITDFIADWHSQSGTLSLPDFLGLTTDEYQASVHGLANLKTILDTQKYKKTT